jgi:hypothetical protein
MSRRAGLFAFFAAFLSLSLSLPTAAQAQNLTSPLIVASGKMVGQTKRILATTLYTPSETGLFRVSVYMCTTKRGNTSNRDWVFNLHWTDDAGRETDQLADLVVNSAPPTGFALSYILPAGFAFEAVGGEPITFTVDPSNGTGTVGAYSLYYTVEQIQ